MNIDLSDGSFVFKESNKQIVANGDCFRINDFSSSYHGNYEIDGISVDIFAKENTKIINFVLNEYKILFSNNFSYSLFKENEEGISANVIFIKVNNDTDKKSFHNFLEDISVPLVFFLEQNSFVNDLKKELSFDLESDNSFTIKNKDLLLDTTKYFLFNT